MNGSTSLLVRCLHNKQNNTSLLAIGDMEFLFSCSTRYPSCSLRSLHISACPCINLHIFHTVLKNTSRQFLIFLGEIFLLNSDCLVSHTKQLVKKGKRPYLRTFAQKSSYGEIFFISPLELVHKVLSPKMKKKMGVTDFVLEKMAVEKCLNFDKSVIITRRSLLC